MRLLFTALILAAALATTAVAAPPVHYRSPYGDVVREPKKIVFKDLTLKRIRWEDWGRRTATGRARAIANTCEPNCAAGNYVRGRARLRMFRRHREDGRRFYGCMTGRIRAEGERSRVVWPPGCND